LVLRDQSLYTTNALRDAGRLPHAVLPLVLDPPRATAHARLSQGRCVLASVQAADIPFRDKTTPAADSRANVFDHQDSADVKMCLDTGWRVGKGQVKVKVVQSF